MLEATFENFDNHVQKFEQFIEQQDIDVKNYWPSRDEFNSAVAVFSDNIFFYILLNYIIENNKETEGASITKKEINTFLMNNLKLVN